MSRTYQQIRQLTMEQTGMLWFAGTVESSGSTTRILRDQTLRRYPNDRFNGYWALLTSGSPSDTELFVKDFYADQGDCRFEPELSAAPDSLTFELLPFSPTDIYNSVIDAIHIAYDRGQLIREHWMYLVGGSPIYNADFGYWTGATALNGWTATTATIARERASGNLSIPETTLSMTTAAGNVALDARYERYLLDLLGSTLTLHCWVKTSATSNARISLYNGAENYSSYHSGSGAWELLSVEVATLETDVSLLPKLYTSTTDTAYFALPFLTGGTSSGTSVVRNYPFALPLMPDGPSHISVSHIDIQRDEIAAGRGHATIRQLGSQRSSLMAQMLRHRDENASTEIGLLDFTGSQRPPSDESLLWLRGDGPLTIPSSALSADIMEVSYSESLLLAKLAARNLLQREASLASPSARSSYDARIEQLDQGIAGLAQGAGPSRDTASYSLRW